MGRSARRLRNVAALVAGVGVLTAAKCSSPLDSGDRVCTAIFAFGINLAITDSTTGTAGGLTGLWARAVDGSYRDSTVVSFNPQGGTVSMALAGERAGTYAVTVHATGYQDWNKSGIVVTKDECHVIGVPVTVKLVK